MIEAALVMVLLLNLAMLSASRLATCIRLLAMQCAVLSVLPLALHAGGEGMSLVHGAGVMAGTLALKVVLIPALLLRAIRTTEIPREVEPLIGFTTSVLIGSLLIAAAFAVRGRLPLPIAPVSPMLLPVAISTALIGLLILVSRIKAITQVVGYLVLENGIFLFGLLLMRQMPLLVELGILLDVFVGVFVMAIVVHHIRREFDHLDTQRLSEPAAGAAA